MYFKQLIIEKAVSSNWRAYFNQTCLNEIIEPLICKHVWMKLSSGKGKGIT